MIVLDESGKEIGKTYPKRARGLVKNGRARFIDETTICLACPPETEISEDIKMNTNIENEQNQTVKEETKAVAIILEKIDELEKNFTERLKTVIDSIVSPEDVEDASYEDYLDAVKSVTVQLNDAHSQSLQIYSKLLDKLTDRPVKTPKEKLIEETLAFIKTVPTEKQQPMLHDLLWSMSEDGEE